MRLGLLIADFVKEVRRLPIYITRRNIFWAGRYEKEIRPRTINRFWLTHSQGLTGGVVDGGPMLEIPSLIPCRVSNWTELLPSSKHACWLPLARRPRGSLRKVPLAYPANEPNPMSGLDKAPPAALRGLLSVWSRFLRTFTVRTLFFPSPSHTILRSLLKWG